LFLSHPFGAQKGAKGTAQTKSVSRSSAHEFSPGENIPRSSFACRQLSLDSRGMRKFGRALTARQKTCTSFPRLSAAVACDFDNAVFFLK